MAVVTKKQLKIIWFYLKYQFVSKTVLAMAILPIFFTMLEWLIRSTGRVAISSGDYITFVASWQGLAALILSWLLIVIVIGLDINAFVVMSGLIHEGHYRLTIQRLLLVGAGSARLFLRPTGLLLTLYIALFVPILGLGLAITPMREVQIPSFILAVIYSNPAYWALYMTFVIALLAVGVRYLFTLHFMLLAGDSIGLAMVHSARLVTEYKLKWIKKMQIDWSDLSWPVLYLIGAVLCCGLVTAPVWLLGWFGQGGWRFLLVFGLLLSLEMVSVLALLVLPLIISLITWIFYQYNQAQGRTVAATQRLKWLTTQARGLRIRDRTIIIIVGLAVMALNGIIAFDVVRDFENSFRSKHSISIIAHRGGGDLAVENTVAGLEQVIALGGIAWSEIDVQRTADGHYIAYHDATFRRLAGDSRSPWQMTLAEVKQLQLKDVNERNQSIASLEELLQVARGRIGLMIELKGRTADYRMVDEVVALVKRYQMADEVALLSLNYSLIQYIEEVYPEIQSGYLYFFAVGQPEFLAADMLIIEEAEATSQQVAKIKAQNKQVVVWTINHPKSVKRFAQSKVDGIITDRVRQVQSATRQARRRNDLEIILDYFRYRQLE